VSLHVTQRLPDLASSSGSQVVARVVVRTGRGLLSKLAPIVQTYSGVFGNRP
jgi:hypothetical protein